MTPSNNFFSNKCLTSVLCVLALILLSVQKSNAATPEQIRSALPGIICLLLCDQQPATTAPIITPPSASIQLFNSASITPIVFTNSGGQNINTCIAQPSLPGTLIVRPSSDGQSCEIVGTPNGEQPASNFTITASNNIGSSSTSISIQIVPAQVFTVSGSISYDLVPTVPTTDNSARLDYNNISQQAVRGASIELLNSTGSVLQSTKTDESGNYSFDLNQDLSVRVRVRAELLKTTGSSRFNVKIVDNTNSSALYTLTEASASLASANSSRDLNAVSGWTGSGYNDSMRISAPFAILDSIKKALDDFIAVDANIVFSPLTVNWSVNNMTASGNLATGEIGTSFYSNSNLYILGAQNNDTDEFDDHIILHEWGHYFEDNLSRSDSIGGAHNGNDRLDMRVAFGEGFGNALSGMITDDPRYIDTLGTQQNSGFVINVENNYAAAQRGWYNESSVQSLLYDFYDSTSDGVDATSLGLAPIYNVLVNEQKNTPALTSIFSFTTALKVNNASAAANIDSLLSAQNIAGASIDQYGTAETNNAGNASGVLPVFTSISVNGGSQNVCTETQYGKPNKLSNFRYLRFTIPVAGTYQFNLTRTSSAYANTDPDFEVVKDGTRLFVGQSGVVNSEQQSFQLSAGEHVLIISDFNALPFSSSPNLNGQACFDVSILSGLM